MKSAALLLAASLTAFSQAGQPVFDTASIKVSPLNGKFETAGSSDIGPASVSMTGATLRACVIWAYGVRDDQVSGPAWLGTEHYDLIAKAAGPTPVPELRLMMRALLADRFGLALHHESRELPVFLMSAADGGAKLTPAAGSGPGKLTIADGTLHYEHFTLTELADRLSSTVFGLGRPVLDRTGIDGKFDVNIKVAQSNMEMKMVAERAAVAHEEQDASPFFEGLRKVGLKLESKKAPVDVLVIDHAEKVPKAN